MLKEPNTCESLEPGPASLLFEALFACQLSDKLHFLADVSSKIKYASLSHSTLYYSRKERTFTFLLPLDNFPLTLIINININSCILFHKTSKNSSIIVKKYCFFKCNSSLNIIDSRRYNRGLKISKCSYFSTTSSGFLMENYLLK